MLDRARNTMTDRRWPVVAVRLYSPESYAALVRTANQAGLSVAGFIRAAIGQAIEEHQSHTPTPDQG
jgi:hypothetical protein